MLQRRLYPWQMLSPFLVYSTALPMQSACLIVEDSVELKLMNERHALLRPGLAAQKAILQLACLSSNMSPSCSSYKPVLPWLDSAEPDFSPSYIPYGQALQWQKDAKKVPVSRGFPNVDPRAPAFAMIMFQQELPSCAWVPCEVCKCCPAGM